MAPPIGSEVLYTEIKTAKVYGYTPDGRVRIKDKPGPGRPKHVPLERVQSPSEKEPPQQPLAVCPQVVQPLMPEAHAQPHARRRGWLAAGFVSLVSVALLSMFNGMVHSMGSKFFDWLWNFVLS
jgi:hypothetical protein